MTRGLAIASGHGARRRSSGAYRHHHQGRRPRGVRAAVGSARARGVHGRGRAFPVIARSSPNEARREPTQGPRRHRGARCAAGEQPSAEVRLPAPEAREVQLNRLEGLHADLDVALERVELGPSPPLRGDRPQASGSADRTTTDGRRPPADRSGAWARGPGLRCDRTGSRISSRAGGEWQPLRAPQAGARDASPPDRDRSRRAGDRMVARASAPDQSECSSVRSSLVALNGPR